MNINQQRAKVTAIMFGCLFLVQAIYFIIVTPSGFLSNSIHYLINAIIFFVCIVSFSIYMKNTNKKENLIDERDLSIQKKSFGASLMITLVYVFLLCIILFTANNDFNFIPVSWLWFIAYSTFAFAYFVTSAIILFYYNKE